MAGVHFLSQATDAEGFRWVDMTKLTWPGVLLTLPLYLLAATLLTRHVGGELAALWPFLPQAGPVESRLELVRHTAVFFIGVFITYPLGRAVDIALRSLRSVLAESFSPTELRRLGPCVPLSLRWKPLGIWVMGWVLLGLFPGVYFVVVGGFAAAASVVVLPWALALPAEELLLALATGTALWSSYVAVAAVWWRYVTGEYYQRVVNSRTGRN